MAVLRPEDWLEPDMLMLLEGWAREGLFDKDIAKKMNVSEATLNNYKKKYPKVKEALRKGKELVDIEVENALFKKAIGYTITINEQKLDKNGCVHDLKREVHFPPDTTAQIFWLKNRKRNEWRDKVEVETNTDELNKVKELLTKISDGANNG